MHVYVHVHVHVHVHMFVYRIYVGFPLLLVLPSSFPPRFSRKSFVTPLPEWVDPNTQIGDIPQQTSSFG